MSLIALVLVASLVLFVIVGSWVLSDLIVGRGRR
jgi:hypothetical protein